MRSGANPEREHSRPIRAQISARCSRSKFASALEKRKAVQNALIERERCFVFRASTLLSVNACPILVNAVPKEWTDIAGTSKHPTADRHV